ASAACPKYRSNTSGRASLRSAPMPTFCEPCPGKRNASLPISASFWPRRYASRVFHPRETRTTDLRLDDRQEDTRRPSGVVEDRLPRGPQVVVRVRAERIAAVRVRVEPRERAARDEHPDPIAGGEQVRCGDEVHRVFVNGARLEQAPLRSAAADDPLGEDERAAVGPHF